jgi:hypothetical protein
MKKVDNYKVVIKRYELSREETQALLKKKVFNSKDFENISSNDIIHFFPEEYQVVHGKVIFGDTDCCVVEVKMWCDELNDEHVPED